MLSFRMPGKGVATQPATGHRVRSWLGLPLQAPAPLSNTFSGLVLRDFKLKEKRLRVVGSLLHDVPASVSCALSSFAQAPFAPVAIFVSPEQREEVTLSCLPLSMIDGDIADRGDSARSSSTSSIFTSGESGACAAGMTGLLPGMIAMWRRQGGKRPIDLLSHEHATKDERAHFPRQATDNQPQPHCTALPRPRAVLERRYHVKLIVWNALSECVMLLVCRPGVSMKILKLIVLYLGAARAPPPSVRTSVRTLSPHSLVMII